MSSLLSPRYSLPSLRCSSRFALLVLVQIRCILYLTFFVFTLCFFAVSFPFSPSIVLSHPPWLFRNCFRPFLLLLRLQRISRAFRYRGISSLFFSPSFLFSFFISFCLLSGTSVGIYFSVHRTFFPGLPSLLSFSLHFLLFLKCMSEFMKQNWWLRRRNIQRLLTKPFIYILSCFISYRSDCVTYSLTISSFLHCFSDILAIVYNEYDYKYCSFCTGSLSPAASFRTLNTIRGRWPRFPVEIIVFNACHLSHCVLRL